MAVKASASITVSIERDIQGTWRFYRIASSSSTPSAPTEAQGKAFVNSGTVPSGWSKVEPSYDGTSTNSLYTVDLTAFTDASVVWTGVSKSSSYEASKAAYNVATSVQTNLSQNYTNAEDLNAALEGKADTEDIPTDVSDLNNDSGFQTLSDVSDRIASDIEVLITATGENTAAISSQAGQITDLETASSQQEAAITGLNQYTVNLSERIEPYEGAVIIETASVTVQSSDGAVKIEPDRVTIRSEGNSVSWADSESFNSKKMVSTELHPRYMDTSSDGTVTLTGSVAIIARKNGHLSIKKVL